MVILGLVWYPTPADMIFTCFTLPVILSFALTPDPEVSCITRFGGDRTSYPDPEDITSIEVSFP